MDVRMLADALKSLLLTRLLLSAARTSRALARSVTLTLDPRGGDAKPRARRIDIEYWRLAYEQAQRFTQCCRLG